MGGDRDGDMTGQDPMSSTAEGDDDPGTAALAESGSDDGADGKDGEDEGHSHASTSGAPPEAYDDTPVTDAVPEEDLGFPEA